LFGWNIKQLFPDATGDCHGHSAGGLEVHVSQWVNISMFTHQLVVPAERRCQLPNLPTKELTTLNREV